MASLDPYLDRVCARLRANPAQVEDIRREIRLHLDDMIADYCAEGMSRPEAIERAIAWLGAAEQIRAGLDFVHDGDPEWVRRVEGTAVGGLLGALLSLFLPFVGHGAAPDAILGVASGACIGLLSTRSRRTDSRLPLLAGFAVGSLTWFSTRIGALAALTLSGDASGSPSQATHLVLLSLVIGGVFGMAVAAGASAVLSLLSPSRSHPR